MEPDEEVVRILVVDDAHLNRVVMQRDLLKEGYQVETAESGEQAVAFLSTHPPFNLVVLDIVLPVMSGIDVLHFIRKRWSPMELPVLMASGRRGVEDVVEALDHGANDYVTKPLNMIVVMARIRVLLTTQALETDLQNRNQQLEEMRDRLQADVDAAARIQSTLLPSELPEDSSCIFHCYSQPCATVGGDIFNVIPLTEHNRAIFLIDVSGHGVQAALLAVALYHMLNATADNSPLLDRGRRGPVPPAQVAERLNRQFQINRRNMQYFTMCYGILDELDGRFTYVQAGHPAPVVVRADGSVTTDRGSGMPIGLMPEPDFTTQTVQLRPGDRLYLYSDGITEAEDPEHIQYGADRLCRRLGRNIGKSLEESVDNLVTDVRRWCGTVSQADDFSVIALEVKR
jgi:phosphoserine phosphatase RsbU/P